MNAYVGLRIVSKEETKKSTHDEADLSWDIFAEEAEVYVQEEGECVVRNRNHRRQCLRKE